MKARGGFSRWKRVLPCLALLMVILFGSQLAAASGDRAAARPLTRVINVIGLKPEAANRALRNRHFKVHYTALTNACAGRPPRGRILAQSPPAGSDAPLYSTVQLQTSCSGRS
jgi:hypothetical protein